MSDFKVNVAFVDTETTGLDPERHDPWEIAIVLYEVEPDTCALIRHIESVHLFVMPLVTDADPGALRMNKYYERVNEASFEWTADEDAAAAHVAHMFGTKMCHVAGMNVPFDQAMISKWLHLNGQKAAWHYHPFELETLMAGALAATGKPVPIPWKSDNLSRALGVEPPTKEERHTAMGDAMWCFRVYESLFGWAAGVDPIPASEPVPDWAITKGDE